MKLVEEYESRVEQCRKLAERSDDAHRQAILNISETWARLAKERRAMLKNKGKKKREA
jgi:hypothetical protein